MAKLRQHIGKAVSSSSKVECLSPETTTGTERENDEKTVDSGHEGSTVVKHLPHHPKAEGLSPPWATGTGRKIITNNSKLGEWW